jgi:hypothetical protein
METKHTPGPWAKYGSVIRSLSGSERKVAEVRVLDDEGQANAKLIAAAPDLLAALQKLHVSLSELNDCGDAGRMVEEDVETARAAISLVLE